MIAARALALGAGATVAFSMPPWGWWPLSFVGIAAFAIAQSAAPRRRERALLGFLFGAGWLFMGMGWMIQLTVPGYLVAGAAYAGLHAAAAAITPVGTLAVIARPVAHTLAEALRFSFPFGGVPLASLGMAQVSGPLAGIGRVGGTILVTWITLQLGFALGAMITSRRSAVLRPTLSGVGVAALVLATAIFVAPRGEATGDTLRVAAVQGGGEQGTSAIEVPWEEVYLRHLETTAQIAANDGGDDDVDLVLWPENTIDTGRVRFADTILPAEIGEQAARIGAPIAVGITEGVGNGDRRVNAHVLIDADGDVVARYDKVRRVPFGEYVPLRGILEFFGAPIDRVGRDAVAGTDPAILVLPDGTPLAIAISWEIFFGGRAREGVELGGEAILNPTNGASYTGTLVQTQQIASSRQRAIENGRFVVQAAPTGFTAFVDAEGRVLERTAISERAVLIDDVELRTGLTWYSRIGDAPWIVLALVALAATWAVELRRRRTAPPVVSDVDDEGDRAVVGQLDAHVGAEAAGGDGQPAGA